MTTAPSEFPSNPRIALLTLAAALVAVAGVAGSLWLSMGMNLKACPLCLYQRTFLMSAASVLLLGLLTEIRRSPILPLLALPLVVGGLGVAGFHVYLESAGKLECPGGILDIGTAPQQSLVVFVVTFLIVLLASLGSTTMQRRMCAGAIALGCLLALATIKSAPPMTLPIKPYEQPLEICRPPYHPRLDSL